MLSLNYLKLSFADIQDLNSFYRERLPEIPKLRSFINTLRLMFSLPPTRIQLQVGQGARVYKVMMKDTKKRVFGWFVLMPLESRIDLFDYTNPEVPVIQWKNKKAVTKNYDEVLINAGIEKVFDRIIGLV